MVPVAIDSEDDIKSNLKALTISSKISNSMREMIGSLMNSRNSLKNNELSKKMNPVKQIF